MVLTDHKCFIRLAATIAVLMVMTAFTASFSGSCLGQSSISSSDARAKQSAQLVEEGIASMERGDAATARDRFQKAIEANPKDLAAHTYLGVIADSTGDLALAELHFATVARLDPTSPAARNNYGAILFRRGENARAATEFEASLRLNSKQPTALVNLAQIRFAQATPESLRAARELFERALPVTQDAEVARALIIVALRLKDKAAAARFYGEYAVRLPNAGAKVKAASARFELGSALLEAELFQESLAELKAAFEADSSNTDTIIRLARAYLALNDIPSAGRTLESTVARGIETPPVYALLAETYWKGGHFENAIPAMRLAVERDPQSEGYRYTYGMLLTNAMAPAAAVIRLEEALQLFPRSARLWFALGIAHFRSSKNDEAIKALSRAVELDAKFAPAYAYLGMTYVELGRYDEGLKLYAQALAVDERLAAVHYLVADVLTKQADSDTPRIRKHLQRAVMLDPTFALARLALGKLLVRLNSFEEAASEFERVVALDPNLPEAYYQLGRVYGRLKRTAEAQANLAKFKQLSDAQKEQSQNERREVARRLANVRF
ncbi:MAG TPA: tetratricopeptide repeat protein [Pyrinomonadaceae bacterium]|jgi:tetratricopeptide (TPR) repeat protein